MTEPRFKPSGLVPGSTPYTKHSTNNWIIFIIFKALYTVILKIKGTMNLRTVTLSIYHQDQYLLLCVFTGKKHVQIFCSIVWIKLFLKTWVFSKLLILWLSFNKNKISRSSVVLKSTKKFPAWEVNDWGEKIIDHYGMLIVQIRQNKHKP